MPIMIDKKNKSIPLYTQLEDVIRKSIEDGIYKPGDMIPKEADYQEMYDLSRITVRQAMNNLADKGYLRRIKGKGTIVLPKKLEEPLLKIKGFTEEMKEKGIIPTTKLASIMISKSFGEVSINLGQKDGDEIYKLRRVRCINNVPIVLFDTFLKQELELDLNNEVYYGSLYDYLQVKKGIRITKVVQRITAAVANKELGSFLGCEVGAPVLILKRQAYDEHGRIVEYTVGKYAADKYEYYFELEE